MKNAGLVAAAALVLATDAFVLVEAAYNRSGAPVASMQLTERELRLLRPQRESTALYLEPQWEERWPSHKFEDGPGWFDQAKLEELGYDCRRPVADAVAEASYGAMPAKDAFAVLEYRPDSETGAEDRATRSRLFPVDAGRDFAALRAKYADARRFLVVPCVVKLFYTAKWDANTRRFAPGAYLRGSVVELQVGSIAAPPGLERLQNSNEYFSTVEGRARGPRYVAVLAYGQNHEPWISSLRHIQ